MALRRAREQASRAQIDFSELNEDDYVVHLEHGIGRFEGMKSIPREDGKTEEVLVVAFADDARLYVPLEQSYLVSALCGRRQKKSGALRARRRQMGQGEEERGEKPSTTTPPSCSPSTPSARPRAGHAFPPDNKWQREFESSFLFKETADQLTAIAASKADMESERPMDRLICGDVGFGKTEVAIRAAFKAVMGGKQVAILVPTTVLAEQHYRNFRERMSDYPVTVELLSRFRTATEQRKTVQGLIDGRVDIVIGTHRLISKDILFKNLGLVVIDEEQRFGVLHKERFKEMFKLVDMLTLSATPIPRTLYLSLMGAKDMSTIETAPLNRIPTETLICPYDERIIRDAINRELSRQGQVYFLHNRVHSIEAMRDKIHKLCPKARCVIGHGQMAEHELEDVMHQFVSGAADVLISTTIIESGLDIPNANTIIIDRADRFGLADLYQLRGRVGRAQHKAYAYLLLPRDMMTQGEARRRINAIKQYSSLGAGFKIAMRDLEIRGAGKYPRHRAERPHHQHRLRPLLRAAQASHRQSQGGESAPAAGGHPAHRFRGHARSGMDEEFRRAAPHIHRQKESVARRAPSASCGCGFVVGRSAFVVAIRSRLSPPAATSANRRPHPGLSQARRSHHAGAARYPAQDVARPLRSPARRAENLLLMTEIKLAASARKITQVEAREGKLILTRSGDYVQIGGKFPASRRARAGRAAA